MVFDVIIGRSKKDVDKYGKRGTVFIGKQYVKMGQTTSLSNPVYMDVAGAHVVFIVGKRGCFVGNTKIKLTNGKNISFKDLIEDYKQGKEYYCYTLKNDGSVGEEKIINPKITERNVEVLKLTFSNNKEVICTHDHRFMLKDLSYKKAKSLDQTDTLKSVNNNKIFVIKKEFQKEKADVYDIEVPNTNNFALDSGLIVHNSGKSYTMGSIAEGLADLPLEIKQNLSIVLLDTMGIYWTMKYPNFQDAELVEKWGFESKGLDVKVYTPTTFYYKYKEEGIPTDFPFSIRPIDVSPYDWLNAFSMNPNSAEGVLLTKVVQELNKLGESYPIDQLIKAVQEDKESERVTRSVVVNEFEKAKGWGIFAREGTPLKDIIAGGQVTVLDVSPYATMPSGWEIKALVVGLICRTLFNQRMLARKTEEFKTVDAAMHYFSREVEEKMEEPLVWVAIDEAHELLPKEGKTAATEALITILREGRQPGISLILASQQPGKIHTDVMTQSDTVLAHRLTARMDVEALGQLTQSYMRQGLEQELDHLPRVKGAAVLFDDANERIFPVQMRPRFTWHGGGSPIAIREKKEYFKKGLNELKEL
ncbi:MAG: DUF87 domain-containing protein [Nanoarchaeota archaeon]|nr:DUF87 domain-containing protein [Nanoarchaeota archaeon]MBU1632049.1 DUF87 domain-containing protein [Nanoarchaeota archaeon]MBU1875824.1 DUF87 domain-containing protein [Nanoarchaeota archaeon]